MSEELVLDTFNLFLELIFDGEKDLLLYRDVSFYSYFFIRQEDELEYLYRGLKVKFNGKQVQNMPAPFSPFSNNTIILKDNYYITQLENAFSKCVDLQSIRANLKYEEEAFIEIFKTYHECQSQEIKFEKSIESNTIAFMILVGANQMNLLAIGGPNYSGKYKHLVHGTYTANNLITGGISLELVLPGRFGRHIFLNDLLYKSFDLKGTWENEPSPFIDRTIVREFDLKMSFIKWNMQYRYKRQIFSTTSLFLNLGIAHNVGLEQANKMVETTVLNGSTTIYEDVALDDLRAYHLGLIGGVGVEYKRFSGEFRYEHGDEISKIIAIGSGTRNYTFLFGYRLN